MKIAVCTPARTETKTRFVIAMEAMLFHSVKKGLKLARHWHVGSSRIDNAREELTLEALSNGAAAIMWNDDDHTFPPDALERLLAHNLPIVGANYRRKEADVSSSAANIVADKIIPLEPKAEGIEGVDLIGFGVVLVRAEVYRAIPRPWYQGGPHGEDGYFCQKAKAHGFQPHVDHALSMEVGHIAETVLTFPR